MKKAFYASLCWEGAQGGGLYADDKGIIFRAQKLTLPEKLKHIKMPYSAIKQVLASRALVFPAVIVSLKNGEEYKFIVFNRETLFKILKSKKITTIG